MKLFEYQSRQLLTDYGIPVPAGELATSADEVKGIVERWKTKAVVKAQVLSGGRGKAGGIKIANNPEEAFGYATKILGMEIAGFPVKKVYVTRAIEIEKEYYLSIVVNRSAKIAECVFSPEGGIDIEEVAIRSPGKITRIPLDPQKSPDKEEIRITLRAADPDSAGSVVDGIADIACRLYELFVEKDCSLLEINPLALAENNELLALDAKIVLDDNGLLKHPELERLRNPEEYSADENDARLAHLAYVSLDGTIGCMVNGAGLSMATMDLIKLAGARPANFLDIGGSSNPRKVVDAMAILLRNPGLEAILLNIFGGITRCDDIANGIVMAKSEMKFRLPIVIRLIGTNDTEGKRILEAAGFEAYNDLTEAVKRVVTYAR